VTVPIADSSVRQGSGDIYALIAVPLERGFVHAIDAETPVERLGKPRAAVRVRALAPGAV
jgi:hypothetical protein